MRALSGRVQLSMIVVIVTTLLGLGVAGASGRATGNAAIIKFYAKGVAHTNARPDYVDTVRGQYYWGYSGSNWRLDADSSKPPYPFEHAVNLVQTIALTGGKVTWELNQFECPTAGGCGSSGSLSIFGSAQGVYWGTTSSASSLPACWNQAGGATAWMVKGYSPGWAGWTVSSGAGFTAQHYVSMALHGSRVVFTSTFTSLSTKARYTEVDTMVAASLTFVGATDHVAATTGHPGYSYSFTYGYPSSPPTPPTPTVCSTG